MVLPRLPPGVLALLVAAGPASGCGSEATVPTPAGERLGQPGRVWPTLSSAEHRTIVRACKLAASVAAGRDDASVSAAYFSDRYRAVHQLPDTRVQRGLDGWFRDRAHGGQTIQQGCTAVTGRLANLARLRRQPRAVFAAPVSAVDGPLTVAVRSARARLRARISPASATLRVVETPDRAPTTVQAAVAREGRGAVTVRLTDIPRGRSYLRVEVTARSGRWRRLLIVTRTRPAARSPAAARFTPIVLSGRGPRTLATLTVPAAALVLVEAGDSPLTLTTRSGLLLAHGAGDGVTAQPLAAGVYREVEVAAGGRWRLRITPAPSSPASPRGGSTQAPNVVDQTHDHPAADRHQR